MPYIAMPAYRTFTSELGRTCRAVDRQGDGTVLEWNLVVDRRQAVLDFLGKLAPSDVYGVTEFQGRRGGTEPAHTIVYYRGHISSERLDAGESIMTPGAPPSSSTIPHTARGRLVRGRIAHGRGAGARAVLIAQNDKAPTCTVELFGPPEDETSDLTSGDRIRIASCNFEPDEEPDHGQ